MQITEWKGSGWDDKPIERLTPGTYDLYIRSARYDDQTGRYAITVEDVQTEKQDTLSWFTQTKGGDVNRKSVGILNSLGRAVFGKGVGVPFPDDVVHAVVHAEIVAGKTVMNSQGEAVQYNDVWHFDPVSKDVYVLVAESGREIIEQYTLEA